MMKKIFFPMLFTYFFHIFPGEEGHGYFHFLLGGNINCSGATQNETVLKWF